jgi:predicted transcriptional regulator of viral defense system
MSAQAVRCRIEGGQRQRLQTGVYAVFTGAADRETTLWAAVLRAGPGSALSYQSAAELDGLLDNPAPLIHVTIPATRRATSIRGAVVHSRLNADLARHPARGVAPRCPLP